MTISVSLTPTEAGFVLDRSPKAINRAIDDGIIQARHAAKGSAGQRVLGAGELRYLGLVKEVGKDLTQTGHRRLYAAVRELPSDVHVIRLGKMAFDLEQVDAELERRVGRLEMLRSSVEKLDGVDVVRGTSVPVHLVAALACGQTTDEIVEDYPQLSPEQIAMAADYARAFPKLGRPHPTRSFKRMIADAAAAGVFEEDPDAGVIEPQLVR